MSAPSGYLPNAAVTAMLAATKLESALSDGAHGSGGVGGGGAAAIGATAAMNAANPNANNAALLLNPPPHTISFLSPSQPSAGGLPALPTGGEPPNPLSMVPLA